MNRRLVWALTFVVLASFAVEKASADVFALNVDFCSSPCLGGGGGGTVTLTLGDGSNGITAGDVKFDVELADPLHFHQTNGLDAFVFNYSGLLSLSFDGLTSGYLTPTNSGAPFHEDGAGNFGYVVKYGAQPATDGQSLLFTAHGATGALILADFETLGANGANVDFAANVTNSVCTGMIGGGNGIAQTSPTTLHSGGACTVLPPSGVPEPTSVLLLGTVLAIVGKALKMQLAV